MGFETVPPTRCNLVPNASTRGQWHSPSAVELRRREPLVVAWDEFQYEKGFRPGQGHRPCCRHRCPTSSVIAGRGTYRQTADADRHGGLSSDIVQFGRVSFRMTSYGAAASARAGRIPLRGTNRSESSHSRDRAAGAPTIRARTGCLAESLEGTDAGVLFEPGHHIALAQRIADA